MTTLSAIDQQVAVIRRRAACAGLNAELWYPEQGRTCTAGRAICAECPVMAQCLELALATGEKQGCWGGAAQRQRRRLYLVWVTRVHDYRADCVDDGCRWCRTVDAHRAACAVRPAERERPMDINGPGARCGFKATYARGCRCVLCSVAISAIGGRLRAAGLDVASWCERWFGPNPGEVDDETRARMLGHARVLAEFDTDEAVAA